MATDRKTNGSVYKALDYSIISKRKAGTPRRMWRTIIQDELERLAVRRMAGYRESREMLAIICRQETALPYH